jgi:hypothetical protein
VGTNTSSIDLRVVGGDKWWCNWAICFWKIHKGAWPYGSVESGTLDNKMWLWGKRNSDLLWLPWRGSAEVLKSVLSSEKAPHINLFETDRNRNLISGLEMVGCHQDRLTADRPSVITWRWLNFYVRYEVGDVLLLLLLVRLCYYGHKFNFPCFHYGRWSFTIGCNVKLP